MAWLDRLAARLAGVNEQPPVVPRHQPRYRLRWNERPVETLTRTDLIHLVYLLADRLIEAKASLDKVEILTKEIIDSH